MKLLKLEEVAELMHWSPGTARNRISNKEPMPPYIQVGHRLLFPESDFKDWVASNLITREKMAKQGVRRRNGVITKKVAE